MRMGEGCNFSRFCPVDGFDTNSLNFRNSTYYHRISYLIR